MSEEKKLVVPGLPIQVREPDYRELYRQARAREGHLLQAIRKAMQLNFHQAQEYRSSEKVQRVLSKALGYKRTKPHKNQCQVRFDPMGEDDSIWAGPNGERY